MATTSIEGEPPVAPLATPQKPQKPQSVYEILSETPKSKVDDAENKNLTEIRKFIADAMDPEVIECQLELFINTYFPFTPSETARDACVQNLIAKDLIKRNERGGLYFPAFRGTVRTRETTENVLFEPLQDIAAAIAKTVVEDRKVNFEYRPCPDTLIAGDVAGSNNRVDACFERMYYAAGKRGKILPSTSLHTSRLAVAMEFKSGYDNAAVVDNRIKVLSANVQIMNDDPARMFSYGITIAGKQVNLWYFSRSHSAVSTSFDFNANPAMFVHVFMAFMFAKPSEMGYDPTVVRHREAPGYYTYKIPKSPGGSKSDRFFRTVKTLSAYRSSKVTGRMTRVWLVDEVESFELEAPLRKEGQGRCVLKDVWLENGASTEWDIQKKIFKDIENSFAQSPSQADGEDQEAFQEMKAKYKHLSEHKAYQQYFLTIVADYIGEKTKLVPADSDNAKRRTGVFVPSGGTLQSAHTGSDTRQSEGVTARKMEETPVPKEIVERAFAQKKQYRVVFKEVCRSVGRLETLGEVMDVLQEMLIPIMLLFLAGWVHRDISSGNLLAYKKDDSGQWRAKLSDLEYAKRFPPDETEKVIKDPKTGTPSFMPVEIQKKKYLFMPKFSKEKAEGIKGAVLPRPAKRAPVIVVHNFQHDLESLWWIILWTLVCRVVCKESTDFGELIFRNSLFATDH
ncbi:hypothetical protein CPC08DRAFT_711279, partial [Agrocybe pediades]